MPLVLRFIRITLVTQVSVLVRAAKRFRKEMVGLPSYGLESQNYFSTKQNKGARAAASDSRHSPKSSKFQQTRPLSQYNGQNLNMSHPKLKTKSPSVNKQSNKQHSERQNTNTTTSPKPIPQNKNSRNNQSSLRSSPSSTRSSPPRSTISPSRSSPNNFASSQCYQPPTPSSLPKPPVAWTASDSSSVISGKPKLSQSLTVVADPTAHLKLLLNVQA